MLPARLGSYATLGLRHASHDSDSQVWSIMGSLGLVKRANEGTKRLVVSEVTE
jgi:hypothetical protein